jgi:uronate dehydrogenase
MGACGVVDEHRAVAASASPPPTDPSRAAPAAGESVAPPLFECLLLTGAAGGLGRVLRPRLRGRARVLRVSDIAPIAAAGEGEEVVTAALQDSAAVAALVEGCDAIVHLGGISTEGPFAPILEANIVGVWNLYEAARRHGVRRVVFASSNHVTGFYRQDEVVAPADPVRPDGHYGLSKAFGENVARFYFDRYGIESVCLRIGSSFPAPKDRRMLATWLSYDDLERLVVASLSAPVVGCSIVYGVSANERVWWDNTSASHLGFRPRDSSESFRAAVEARRPAADPRGPAALFQGGAFVAQGPFESTEARSP